MTGGRALRRAAGRAIRLVWQSQPYVVYRRPDTRAERELTAPPNDVRFVGINQLRADGEGPCPAQLPEQYREFASSGEDGVVALRNGVPVAWVWARHGPFAEPSWPGRLLVGPGVRVVHFFEVVPEARGQGLGKMVLSEFDHRLDRVPPMPTIAFVGEQNQRSRRSFERLGYVASGRLIVRNVLRHGLATRVPDLPAPSFE